MASFIRKQVDYKKMVIREMNLELSSEGYPSVVRVDE